MFGPKIPGQVLDLPLRPCLSFTVLFFIGVHCEIYCYLFLVSINRITSSIILISFCVSEATQKAQTLPGRQSAAETQMHKTSLEVSGGQQDEPGLALSPDGPGASPEPPSVSHTPDGNAAADTLASDMLRKLAGTSVCHNKFVVF